MQGLLIDIAVAIATGAGLWALLPRGVVLTRCARTQDWRGEPVYDTWELRNESALPVSITSVMVLTPEHPDGVQLTWANEGDLHVSLSFDEAHLETMRTERHQAWKAVQVPPGDTLRAHVPNNRLVRVKYRRAGFTGIFERRQVVVHGYV